MFDKKKMIYARHGYRFNSPDLTAFFIVLIGIIQNLIMGYKLRNITLLEN